jgi:Domain of unknown function (DUF4157)
MTVGGLDMGMNTRQWLTTRQKSGAERPRETGLVRPARLQRDLLSLAASRKAGGQGGRILLEKIRRAAASPAGHSSVLQLQRSCGNHCVQKTLKIGRNEQGETVTKGQVETEIDSARGGGANLDSGVRAQMESSFGADFGGVRVHDNSQADSLNRSLSALAFTTGNDIFFRQGKYQPGSSDGRRLLAHELTHVVQQNSGPVRETASAFEVPESVQPSLTVSEPHDALELEADRMAHLVMEQEHDPNDRRAARQAVPEEEEREELQAQRQELPEEEEEVQRMPQPEAEEDKEEPVRTKAVRG